jgi:hypothetical protein
MSDITTVRHSQEIPAVAQLVAITPIETARARLAVYAEANASANKVGTATVLAALAAGVALIPVMEDAPVRGRQQFIRTSLDTSKTIVNQCIRIAKDPARVQVYLDGSAVQSHSVRGLLRFLSPPRAKTVKTPLVTAWNRASDDERKALFNAIAFDEACLHFPAEWFRRLDQRYTDQLLRVETTGNITVDLTNPPSAIVKARKALRLALARARPDGERLNAMNMAETIRVKNGFTFDDLCPVPDPANAGKPTRTARPARRRAA